MIQQESLLPAKTERNNHDGTAAAEGRGPTGVQRSHQSLDNSVSDNTRASYRSAWKTFAGWAQAHATPAIPASHVLVAAYLSVLPA